MGLWLHDTISLLLSLCTSSTAGADYVPVNRLLTFGPSDPRLCIGVPILDDAVVENDEIISLILSLESAINGVSIGRPTSTITILDGNGEYSKQMSSSS